MGFLKLFLEASLTTKFNFYPSRNELIKYQISTNFPVYNTIYMRKKSVSINANTLLILGLFSNRKIMNIRLQVCEFKRQISFL